MIIYKNISFSNMICFAYYSFILHFFYYSCCSIIANFQMALNETGTCLFFSSDQRNCLVVKFIPTFFMPTDKIRILILIFFYYNLGSRISNLYSLRPYISFSVAWSFLLCVVINSDITSLPVLLPITLLTGTFILLCTTLFVSQFAFGLSLSSFH